MRHAEAYTVLFDGFVRRLCATASRDDSLRLLALHRRRWRSGASDLLVHAARDGAARGRLRAFAGGLLGRAEGAGAVGPPAELDADAALNLGPRRGHEEEERGDGEDGCDAVQGGSSHSAIAAAGGDKVGSGAGPRWPRTSRGPRPRTRSSISAPSVETLGRPWRSTRAVRLSGGAKPRHASDTPFSGKTG